MYKLVFIMIMLPIWLYAQILQVEQELSMKAVYLAKQAVNRAVHAAAQQLDEEALADGEIRIDSEAAWQTAKLYLQKNLELDQSFKSLSPSSLLKQIKITVFSVINEVKGLPYTYKNEQYAYEVMVKKPAVIMIIEVDYNKAFQLFKEVKWNIKGTAEITLHGYLTL